MHNLSSLGKETTAGDTTLREKSYKATALSLQINLALFNLHLLKSWWVPFFVANTLGCSQDVPKLSGAKPEAGLLLKEPGKFNSLGQLLGCISPCCNSQHYTATCSPIRYKRCPPAKQEPVSLVAKGRKRKQQTGEKEGPLGDVIEIIVL